MASGAGAPLPSFLGRPHDRRYEVRAIVLEPGAERTYAGAEWADSLVVVEVGTIELESMTGLRRTFTAGDVLWLAGLRLRLLRNSGRGPAVLSATSRSAAVQER